MARTTNARRKPAPDNDNVTSIDSIPRPAAKKDPAPPIEFGGSGYLLPGEDPAQLQQVVNACYKHLQPRSTLEAALVDQLVLLHWRFLRTLAYDATSLIIGAEELHPKLAAQYQSISIGRLFAAAYLDQTKDKSANPSLNRQLVATRNMYRSILRDLKELRSLRGDDDMDLIPPPMVQATNEALNINEEVLPVPGMKDFIQTPDEPKREEQPEMSEDLKEAYENYTPPPQEPEIEVQPEPVPQPEPQQSEWILTDLLDANGERIRMPRGFDRGESKPHVKPKADTDQWLETAIMQIEESGYKK